MGSDAAAKAAAKAGADWTGVVGFLSGLLLGLGVAVSGMADSRRSSAFFNLANLGTPMWDPTMGIVFATALAANSVLYHLVQPSLSKPLLGDSFAIPTRRDTPIQLFLGAFLFGCGWSIGGFCPGPAIVAAVMGELKTLLFLLGLTMGWFIHRHQSLPRGAAGALCQPSASGAVKVLAAASVTLAVLIARDAAFERPVPVSEFATSYAPAVMGGIMIGSSVGLMMILSGQILGISGIVAGLVDPRTTNKPVRAMFVAGLVTAGFVIKANAPTLIANHMHRHNAFFVLGGLLCGYGTSLGSGCTSGHGIAGLTRMSIRSIYAVATFFLAQAVCTTALFYFWRIGHGWQLALR